MTSLRGSTSWIWLRNIVIFPPCKAFKMGTAGKGEIRGFSKGRGCASIQVAFQSTALSMSFMIGFHDPELGRSIRQRVGDLAELNSMYNFAVRNCAGCSRKIRVGGRVVIVQRCSCHGENRSGRRVKKGYLEPKFIKNKDWKIRVRAVRTSRREKEANRLLQRCFVLCHGRVSETEVRFGKIINVRAGCQRLARHMEDEGGVVGVPMWYVRRI